jgi:hypothetical protein
MHPTGNRLLSLIANLTPSDLGALRSAIISDEQRKNLIAIIDSALKFHGDDDAIPSSPTAHGLAELSPKPTEYSFIDHKRIFYSFLENRDTLPTTKDVLKLINLAFSSSYKIADFQKAGRIKLIDRAWKRLAEMSPSEQMRVLNRLIYNMPEDSKASADYQRLFKFLTSDERRG